MNVKLNLVLKLDTPNALKYIQGYLRDWKFGFLPKEKLLSHLAHYNSQLHFNEHNSSPLEKLSKFFRKLMQSISGSKVYNQVKYFLKYYYLSINTINAKKIFSQEETGENTQIIDIRQHQNIKEIQIFFLHKSLGTN